MGAGSWIHWVAVVVVVVLIFGTKKIANIGPDLGKAIRGFKEGLKGDAEKTPASSDATEKNTIDIDAKEKSKL